MSPARTSTSGRAQDGAGLSAAHLELLGSANISEQVALARGYTYLSDGDVDADSFPGLSQVRSLTGPVTATGLASPLYDASGTRVSTAFLPHPPGSPLPAAAALASSRWELPLARPRAVDVHPQHTEQITDPEETLWLTEGCIRADAITTAGGCAVSLEGLFAWRHPCASLTGWDQIPLDRRTVVLCFDSNAATDRYKARAMARAGRFLHGRGAEVRYLICPHSSAGQERTVGECLNEMTLQQLLEVAAAQPPDVDAGKPLTDARMTETLADDVLADGFRYVPELKSWLRFDGRGWHRCDDLRVVEETRLWVRGLVDAAAAAADGSRAEELAKYLSSGKLRAITGLAKGIACTRAALSDFDAHPYLFSAGNGVVDLTTLELWPHDPALLMSRGTDVEFHPGATHPDWDRARQALPDQQTCDFLLRVFGSGAIGVPPREDIITVLQGNGANGKSTLLGAITNALGDYARLLPGSILGSRHREHPTEMMTLRGARLAFVEETADKHTLDMTKLKKITGTDSITGRYVGQNNVVFRATHTMVITTNFLPVVHDIDDGTWRRLQLVRFDKTFQGADLDPQLRGRVLNGESQQRAVLASVLSAARDYNGNGLGPQPGSVQEATAAWRQTNDVIAMFAATHLCAAPDSFVEIEHLRTAFNGWLPKDRTSWSRQDFAERFQHHKSLRDLGASRDKHPVTRRSILRGVAIRSSEERAVE